MKNRNDQNPDKVFQIEITKDEILTSLEQSLSNKISTAKIQWIKQWEQNHNIGTEVLRLEIESHKQWFKRSMEALNTKNNKEKSLIKVRQNRA